MHAITLVTSNEKKAMQFSAWLGFSVERVPIDLPEPQTMDMAEIVRAKASAAYAALQRPVLVEDTALVFTALGGLPGPFTKFFLAEGKAELLCKLASINTDRSAVYSVWIGYQDEHGLHIVHGEVSGRISESPSPLTATSFGFDRCFVPDGHAVPRAELDKEAFEASSARKRAIDILSMWLLENKKIH